MSYKQLPNGKHHWNFRLGGKESPRREVTDADFRKGEREVRRLISEYENGLSPASVGRGLCFYDICEGYLDAKKGEPNCTHQKEKTISSQIKGFKALIENYRLDQFNTKAHAAYNAVTRWRGAYLQSKNRLGGKISPHSVNRKFNTLRAVFNWAIQQGMMRDNPCKRSSKFKTAKPKPRFLSKDELEKLVHTARRPEFRNYCEIILNTGMRPNEALGLDITQIDIDNFVITGFKQKDQSRLGVVPIIDSLVGPLKRMIGKRTSGSLLNYTAGQLREDAEWGIKEACLNAVVRPGTSKFTIYGLRHVFASNMIMRGKSVETVAKFLRNGIEICYEHYGHLSTEFLREAGKGMDLMPKMQLKVVGGDLVEGAYEKL